MKSAKKHCFSALAFIACAVVLLFGCSANGAGDQPSPDSGRKTGYFIDSAVAGLSYVTSSGLTGVTDENGSFSYNPGDTVRFFLGETLLVSSVSAEEVISPLMLCGATSLTDSSDAAMMATNLIRLFLALDTGDNAYGMTLPSTLGEIDIPDLGELLSSATFETDAKTVVAAAKSVLPDAVTLPDADAAKEHWAVSEKLAAEIAKMKDTENFILTVKVPSGFAGRSLGISYRAQSMPAGMTSYTSGTSRIVPNDGTDTVTFTGYMHASKWTMTLSLFTDVSKVLVNDIFSFYGDEGFTNAIPAGFPLDMNGGFAVLSADLSTDAGITVTNKYLVSGNILLPNTLPDNTKLNALTGLPAQFHLFCNILDPAAMERASYALRMDIPATGWGMTTIDSVEYVAIPYSTSLAGGYPYRIQLFYGTTNDMKTRFKAYAWASINEPLASDQTGKDFKVTKWESPTGSVAASMRSASDATNAVPVHSITGDGAVLELR